MKIFKHPQFDVVTCKKCGTVFQPEASDTLEYRFLPSLGEVPEVYTRCPTCEWYCEVTVVEELSAEQNATDINDGGKSEWQNRHGKRG